MRTFDRFPEHTTCPVCGTSFQGSCFLMPIHGTRAGDNYEAQPIHVKCIDTIMEKAFFDAVDGIVYAKIRR